MNVIHYVKTVLWMLRLAVSASNNLGLSGCIVLGSNNFNLYASLPFR